LGEPEKRKVPWTFRPANAAGARNHARDEAGSAGKAKGPVDLSPGERREKRAFMRALRPEAAK